MQAGMILVHFQKKISLRETNEQFSIPTDKHKQDPLCAAVAVPDRCSMFW